MKRFTSIFFIIILSLPALYKVGLFTFFQFNRDYIAQNYCVNKDKPIALCYGKCFLERGIQLVDQTPSSQSISSSVKFETAEFLVHEINLSFHQPIATAPSFQIQSTPSLTHGFLGTIFRPPLG